VAVVLPAFAHETLADLTRCIPHELSGTMPNLRVRVLVAGSADEGSPQPVEKSSRSVTGSTTSR
jgi:hypothetical protein